MTQTEERILDFMGTEKLSQGAIAEGTGLSSAAVSTYMDSLVRRKVIVREVLQSGGVLFFRAGTNTRERVVLPTRPPGDVPPGGGRGGGHRERIVLELKKFGATGGSMERLESATGIKKAVLYTYLSTMQREGHVRASGTQRSRVYFHPEHFPQEEPQGERGVAMAEIRPLTSTTPWSARAAAGDAQQRVPDDAPFIALWIDPATRRIHYSKTLFKEAADMAVLAAFLQSLVLEFIRGK